MARCKMDIFTGLCKKLVGAFLPAAQRHGHRLGCDVILGRLAFSLTLFNHIV